MSSTQNTKLCDFTSTNNNDFNCTPIAPPASLTAFYEIKPALLNLVMKEQFSGASIDHVVVHLNNFVELCEMQKNKCRVCDPGYPKDDGSVELVEETTKKQLRR